MAHTASANQVCHEARPEVWTQWCLPKLARDLPGKGYFIFGSSSKPIFDEFVDGHDDGLWLGPKLDAKSG